MVVYEFYQRDKRGATPFIWDTAGEKEKARENK